jgi:hypothetical protein
MNSKPRAATIFCKDETYVAIVEKHDYKKVIGAALYRKM